MSGFKCKIQLTVTKRADQQTRLWQQQREHYESDQRGRRQVAEIYTLQCSSQPRTHPIR